MVKNILAAAVATLVLTAPAMAQVQGHQNPSLNGYAGFGNANPAGQQPAHPTTPTMADSWSRAGGSGNPSLESFSPNAVSPQPSRFGSSPSVAEHPDFDWIDRYDIGA